MGRGTDHERLLDAARNALVLVAYVAVAKLGLMLGAVSGFATLVWAPSGVAVAALLLAGNRLAPGVFFGALVTDLWAGAPVAVAVGLATGSTLEALLGAYAVRRIGGFHDCFERSRHVLALIGPAALVATLVSATVGVTSLRLGGVIETARFGETWRAWWIGDALGVIVVAPLLLSWGTGRRITAHARGVAEGVVLAAALACVSYAVFLRPHNGASTAPIDAPYEFFPLFVWAALRFELRGATAATAFVSACAIWGTVAGTGPFVRGTLAESLLVLQTFMGFAVLTPLILAGAVADRARAMRIRDAFVCMVSHDLRSPLSALRLSSERLDHSAGAGPTGGLVHKHCQLVRRSVDRMNRLIADVLDAASLEAGRLPIALRHEDAAELLREAIDMLQPLAAEKQQTLRVEVDEPTGVLCDRERVLQVLSNLIGNAIKFSDKGATITVRQRRAGALACVSVEDRGSGIEPAELAHVFERFWHGGAGSGGGAGLGLYIAKGIVEAHRGKIWATSRAGVGSTFAFTLPAGETPRARPIDERGPGAVMPSGQPT